ncbi:MAG: pyridoxamine 5'-phosphate oxidase family protein [Gemmatimonadaceae bacterium]|nr:pyridoxamine 5'-phosphate oxidase family protein [Gemmatimonadaceae bacterium]
MTPTSPHATRATFRELEQADCERILARNHVARLAFSFHDRVDIEPISYIYENGWLHGRTSPGSKLHTIAHSHWVALEVDEIEGQFDWRSVVVHGTFLTLDPEVPGVEADAWMRGRKLLRAAVPEFGTAGDPGAFRTVMFRIHIDSLTGREARSRGVRE